MYNTSSFDNINQLYASIEEFDGDIERLIDNWGILYPSVKSQLETADELNLLSSFADILLENGKLELASSVDENIQEILESDAEGELDDWNRHRFYSLINGRWNGQANSPTVTKSRADGLRISSQYRSAFLHQDEIPRSCTPIARPSHSQYHTASSSRDEIPRGWAPKACSTSGPLQGVESSERTTNKRQLPDQESSYHRSTIEGGGTSHENTSLAPLLGQTYEPSFGPKQYAPFYATRRIWSERHLTLIQTESGRPLANTFEG